VLVIPAPGAKNKMNYNGDKNNELVETFIYKNLYSNINLGY
jgi:hypothetical protein